jgi:hypothetical protein
MGRSSRDKEKHTPEIPSVILKNGVKMPHIGLGVLFQPNNQTVKSVHDGAGISA